MATVGANAARSATPLFCLRGLPPRAPGGPACDSSVVLIAVAQPRPSVPNARCPSPSPAGEEAERVRQAISLRAAVHHPGDSFPPPPSCSNPCAAWSGLLLPFRATSAPAPGRKLTLWCVMPNLPTQPRESHLPPQWSSGSAGTGAQSCSLSWRRRGAYRKKTCSSSNRKRWTSCARQFRR